VRSIGRGSARTLWSRIRHSDLPTQRSGSDRPALEGDGRDETTGLLNRAGMRHLLTRWAEHDVESCPVAVAYLELDGMTHLTHVRGPETVDDVVHEVAAELNGLGSLSTGVGRLGTGEFVIARRLTHPIDAFSKTAALDTLEREVHDSLRRSSTAAHPRPRASMGLAVGDLATVRQPWSLVLMAYDLCSEARRRGGNSTLRESHGLGRRLRRRDDIAMAMHSAVTGRELRLVFHPIVDLADRTPIAAEALLRWTNRELGIVPPAEFIPLMEPHQSMRLVDDWVVNQAIDAVLGHRSTTAAVSINASPLSLQENGYAESLLARVDRLNLAPERLWLEVTETALSSHPEALLRTLGQLRRAGIRILLDDFGTGHSSLTTLADLPVDWIKLDGQLIVGARDNDRRLEVLHFAAQLGRSLGHEVVAEHIETVEDETLARSAGCTYGQGFLYSTPMADFTAAMQVAS
jgi:EAL domain-containing protein (putative c-di-GMP-specific phosphodiesterase class I)/GGDEF domain-containing protein